MTDADGWEGRRSFLLLTILGTASVEPSTDSKVNGLKLAHKQAIVLQMTMSIICQVGNSIKKYSYFF